MWWCPSSSWDRVDFFFLLYNVQYDAMFWLWEENNVDNTPVCGQAAPAGVSTASFRLLSNMGQFLD